MLLLMFGFCTSVLECILCMYEVFFSLCLSCRFFSSLAWVRVRIFRSIKLNSQKLKYTHIAHKKPASNKKRKRIKKKERSKRNNINVHSAKEYKWAASISFSTYFFFFFFFFLLIERCQFLSALFVNIYKFRNDIHYSIYFFLDVWFQCRTHSHTPTLFFFSLFFIYINFEWAILVLDLAHNMFDASFHCE